MFHILILFLAAFLILEVKADSHTPEAYAFFQPVRSQDSMRKLWPQSLTLVRQELAIDAVKAELNGLWQLRYHCNGFPVAIEELIARWAYISDSGGAGDVSIAFDENKGVMSHTITKKDDDGRWVRTTSEHRFSLSRPTGGPIALSSQWLSGPSHQLIDFEIATSRIQETNELVIELPIGGTFSRCSNGVPMGILLVRIPVS